MWPILLDMTKEESMQNLRCLELDAFAGLVTAFRAQGCLNPEKLKLLTATGSMLNIPLDRHKAEIRRAVNDEKLNTIAYHTAGHRTSLEDWAQEGRRLIPLLSRVAAQTVYSAIADEVADTASRTNKLLPHPACTERKRSAPASPTIVSPSEGNKTFRVTQDGGTPKIDDTKKRKLSPSACDVHSVGSVQLMGPPKGSRAQSLNRMRAKVKQKDNLQLLKLRQQLIGPNNDRIIPTTSNVYSKSTKPLLSSPSLVCNFPTKPAQSQPITDHVNNSFLGKGQVVHNIMISPAKNSSPIIDTHSMDCSDSVIPDPRSSPSASLTIPLPIPPIANNKPSLTKNLISNKMIKVCPARKTVTTNTGQKLVVVSNPSTNILQRTLSIPFVKNITVKNYEKFKIVPPSSTNLHLSPLTTGGLNHFKNSANHKVVTVRTNGSGHNNTKVVPFNQIHMLNAKGIKLLPFGSKFLTKTTTATCNNANNSIYLVNSVAKTNATDTIVSPQMVSAKLPVISESNNTCPSTATLRSTTLTDFESEIVQHTIDQSVDESSSESSSDGMRTNMISSVERHNHGNAGLDSVGNHVVEEEDDEEREENDEVEEEEEDDDDGDDAEDDEENEDGNTNDSYKLEGNVAAAEEQRPFYVLENEHVTVEEEMLHEQPSCVIEQLDPCPYSELDSNEIQLQEELVTMECEPTLDSGMASDAVLDFNTFDS